MASRSRSMGAKLRGRKGLLFEEALKEGRGKNRGKNKQEKAETRYRMGEQRNED